jgi:Kef-type K+ transport system membrane component KefB
MITILVLGLLQLLMIILYLCSGVSARAFSIECTVLNFIVATCVWVIMFITSLKYSGSPYKSTAYKIKMRKLTIANIIWCACRYLRGISGAFEQ